MSKREILIRKIIDKFDYYPPEVIADFIIQREQALLNGTLCKPLTEEEILTIIKFKCPIIYEEDCIGLAQALAKRMKGE